MQANASQVSARAGAMAARDGHPTEMDIATLELQRAMLGLKLAHARTQAIGGATRPLKRPVDATELTDALHKRPRPLDGSMSLTTSCLSTVAKLLAALPAIGGFQRSFHFGQCHAAVSDVYG